MTKKYVLKSNSKFKHSCEDYAIFKESGNGKAICTYVENCYGCPEIGHDDDHIFAMIGDEMEIEDLLQHPYLIKQQGQGNNCLACNSNNCENCECGNCDHDVSDCHKRNWCDRYCVDIEYVEELI